MTRAFLGVFLIAGAGVAFAASHEDETKMAKGSKVTLQEAMKTATAKIPGRVLWSARERFDGGTFVMVEVIADDRSDRVVTIDATSGRVIKVEPAKNKAETTATGTGEGVKPAEPKTKAVKGTISVAAERTDDYPYLAKVSMDDAVKAALKKHPGRLVEVYVYAESGFLLYGIETSSRVGRITLVKIDAGTGRILSAEKM